jgi:site-specific recombinase XerD
MAPSKRTTSHSSDPSSYYEFPAALKSFTGYLEGTQKSAHTIKNYRLDLLSFRDFLNELQEVGVRKLADLTSKEVEGFHDHLKAQGQKTNTRRRKLLTVQRFLLYLSNRNKVPIELARRMPTPHKIERVPSTVPYADLLEAIWKLPQDTVLDRRNRALLAVLAETGCQVSEVGLLRFSCFKPGANGAGSLDIPGKAPRSLEVSARLMQAVDEVRKSESESSGGESWVFQGYNNFGSLGGPISSRGVELLVRAYGVRLGFPDLVPRTFRHSVVLHWYRQGEKPKQLREKLGLKTDYAFRVFEPLFATIQPETKSSSTSTSTS